MSELVGIANQPDRLDPVVLVEVERDNVVRDTCGGDQQAGLAVDEHRLDARIRPRATEDAEEPAGDIVCTP